MAYLALHLDCTLQFAFVVHSVHHSTSLLYNMLCNQVLLLTLLEPVVQRHMEEMYHLCHKSVVLLALAMSFHTQQRQWVYPIVLNVDGAWW